VPAGQLRRRVRIELQVSAIGHIFILEDSARAFPVLLQAGTGFNCQNRIVCRHMRALDSRNPARAGFVALEGNFVEGFTLFRHRWVRLAWHEKSLRFSDFLEREGARREQGLGGSRGLQAPECKGSIRMAFRPGPSFSQPLFC